MIFFARKLKLEIGSWIILWRFAFMEEYTVKDMKEALQALDSAIVRSKKVIFNIYIIF